MGIEGGGGARVYNAFASLSDIRCVGTYEVYRDLLTMAKLSNGVTSRVIPNICIKSRRAIH